MFAHSPSTVDPLIPLTFLTELHDVLQNYIAATVSEASLKVSLRRLVLSTVPEEPHSNRFFFPPTPLRNGKGQL